MNCGLGPSLRASLGKQRLEYLTLALYPSPSLGLWLLVLANNVCPSSFLVETPLLERGDKGAQCRVWARRWGKWLGGRPCFWRRSEPEQSSTTGICWHPHGKASSGHSLSPEILHEGGGNGLDVQRPQGPPTLAQHSLPSQALVGKEGSTEAACTAVSDPLEDVTGV